MVATEEHHHTGPTHEHSHSETRVSGGGDSNMAWVVLAVVLLIVLGLVLFWVYGGNDDGDGGAGGGTSSPPTSDAPTTGNTGPGNASVASLALKGENAPAQARGILHGVFQQLAVPRPA